MELKPVYMNTIELQNKIFIEFETIHQIQLNIKELNEVIEDYIKECESQGPMTTWDFVQTYLDKF